MEHLNRHGVADRTKYDVDYRPETYWPPVTDRLRWQISRIKGEARRRAALARLAQEGPAALETWMLAHDVGRKVKDAVQGLHPGLRGGEDLPDLGRREVEIARIWFTRTVHCEVTSVRARPAGDRIRYRVVDEYGKDCGYTFVINPRSSRHPLTLGQLVTLIDTATCSEDSSDPPGLVVPYWDDWMQCETDPETPAWFDRGFVGVLPAAVRLVRQHVRGVVPEKEPGAGEGRVSGRGRQLIRVKGEHDAQEAEEATSRTTFPAQRVDVLRPAAEGPFRNRVHPA